jgi:hypothetical protein
MDVSDPGHRLLCRSDGLGAAHNAQIAKTLIAIKTMAQVAPWGYFQSRPVGWAAHLGGA